MPFHFTCPYCFNKTLVDDSVVGESGPCINCGKAVTVTAPELEQPENAHPVKTAYVRAEKLNNKNIVAMWAVRGVALLVLTITLGSIVVFLFAPVVSDLKLRRDSIACMNNASQIVAALSAYASDYGTYPPPVIYDSAGKPMHSWRVLVLPYLGEDALHAQYDFDEPWDSQQNAALLASCPEVYISPPNRARSVSESSYMLITGQGTAFPASGPVRPSQIIDGLANTLLVVEVQNTIYEWTRPMDINFSKMNARIGAGGANSLGGSHNNGAAGAFANGDPAWLRSDIDPNILDSLITINGSEPVNGTNFRLD